MNIYGLFEYSYDWYEFEEFKVASKKIDKLEKSIKDGWTVVYSEIDHSLLVKEQERHYWIKQLEII